MTASWFIDLVANFVVQWGDPLTKTLPLTDPSIGTGGRATPSSSRTAVFRMFSTRWQWRAHVRWVGYGREPDLYQPGGQLSTLDGQYCVFGSVLAGADVVNNLVVGDQLYGDDGAHVDCRLSIW